MLNSLFKRFDNIIIIDTETTGFDPRHDEIIEIAILRKADKQGIAVIEDDFSTFIKLSPGRSVPPVVTGLTGITEKQLLEEGVSKEQACERVAELICCPNPVLVAYNAQFDLCFLYFFLDRFGKVGLLKNIKMLDALTIYRDRRPYPHKLSDAVLMYSLSNSANHRALDDARTTFELLCKMGEESDDLERYVNLFGYNPKYGINGPKISSVKYSPQGYGLTKKLYEA